MSCDRCGGVRSKPENRFCKACEKAVKKEMREAGYLTPAPMVIKRFVDPDKRAVRDYDADADGSWGNVLRASEE